MKLFDAIVKPILTLYASDVRCQQFIKQISDVDMYINVIVWNLTSFITICKQILGVGKYSNNLAARLELERLPTSMFIKKQVLKYRNKLEKCSHESILCKILLIIGEIGTQSKYVIMVYCNCKYNG